MKGSVFQVAYLKDSDFEEQPFLKGIFFYLHEHENQQLKISRKFKALFCYFFDMKRETPKINHLGSFHQRWTAFDLVSAKIALFSGLTTTREVKPDTTRLPRRKSKSTLCNHSNMRKIKNLVNCKKTYWIIINKDYYNSYLFSFSYLVLEQ